ncbi:chalcone isomerase family protein [Reinekea marina]|uniref:Chalcone isomerase family protein n=1 Tax=Reinekea marina TaxID=1310421 RepID=A0ABV7WUY7_9GAMM|nr:chalcone isomerase family protein [Reinekea marina]MDN3648912.1 chalcone isomerase family protein [Reinekea marina]
MPKLNSNHCIAIAFLILASLFFSSVALAASERLVVGQGAMKKFGFHLYDISLYTETGQYLPEAPLDLEIVYKINIAQEKLVEISASEVARTGGIWLDSWSEQLTRIWPDIRKGDQLTLTIQDSGESVFVYNGKEIGRIVDTRFGVAFSAIWLSPDTREPKLRAKLIGLKK